MIRLIYFLLTLLGAAIWSTLTLANQLDWLKAHSKSVARITFLECVTSDACENEVNRKRRVASGFLFKNQTGQDVVVTALHAVIGRGDIFYHFQEAGAAKTRSRIIGVNIDADIAFLELKYQPKGVKPLVPRFEKSNNSPEVYVVGYPHGVSAPIDTKGRRRVLDRKLGVLLPVVYHHSIKEQIGFPNLEAHVISLDKALAPGDSGAPVFDRDGYVIGIGNGGIPNTGSYISWAMPIQETRKVKSWSGEFLTKERGQNSKVLYTSMAVDRLYYPHVLLRNDRPIGHVKLSYALRFDTTEGRLNEYIRDMAQVDGNFLFRRTDGTFFGGVPMRSTDPTFPGSTWATKHLLLLQDLNRLRINLICYSGPVFQRILDGEIIERDAKILLEIDYSLGDIRRQVNQERIEFSVAGRFQTMLNVSALQAITLETFSPGVKVTRNYDVNKPQELLGALCRVEFDQRPGITSQYERALAQGEVYIRLQLSELLAFDLIPPSVLPSATNPSRLELWASLPPRPVLVSDDINSMFKWR